MSSLLSLSPTQIWRIDQFCLPNVLIMMISDCDNFFHHDFYSFVTQSLYHLKVVGWQKKFRKSYRETYLFFKRYFPSEITYEIFTVVVGQVKPLACQFLGFQANLKYRFLSFNSEKRTEKAFSKKRFFGL